MTGLCWVDEERLLVTDTDNHLLRLLYLRGEGSVITLGGTGTLFTQSINQLLDCSVGDPGHFGADPDPWIRTYLDLWIRIQLLSSMTLRTLGGTGTLFTQSTSG
jgi:hypothetical protein